MDNTVISQELPVPTATPGIADIVGFGTKGVVVLRNSVNLQPTLVISDFGSQEGGWSVAQNVRLLGDTRGNGAADVIGFGTSGVLVALNNGNNRFQPAQLVLNDFGTAQGWTNEKHIRFAADLRKNGRVDLIGFGEAGVLVSLNDGRGAFGPAQLAIKDFGYASGWRVDCHPRFLADVTGDLGLDVIGFGETSVYVACANGDGTFRAPRAVLADMCAGAGGWQSDRHPRTVADVNGDGRADLVGFGDAGVYVAVSEGGGTFAPARLVLDDFSYAQGWRVGTHPRFVADLTGNRCGDIVGFKDDGVWVALNNGDGTFRAPVRVLADFGAVAGGWRADRHLRFVVDVTGDGCADIVGFGETAVWVSVNDGNGGFLPVQKLTDAFGYNNGEWALDKTVRYLANLYA